MLCCWIAAILLAAAFADDAPPVGFIDFYGLRTITIAQARTAVALKEGQPPTEESARKSEEALKRIPGVADASVTVVCCEKGRSIVYAGILERGSPRFELRTTPRGTERLPPEITNDFTAFTQALEVAVRKGDAADDLSQGHSFLANAACRAIQERFLVEARRNPRNLREVLRNSGDAEQRRAAAWVTGYAPDKRSVIGDLEFALSDPDADVRNNAMRALAAIATLARRRPELGIRIRAAPFIRMLNSVAWTDRNKSALALEELTADRDPAVLTQLRAQALPSLIEMSRWKVAGHAEAAFVLLARVAGWAEDDILPAWNRGDREKVIAEALR